MELEMFLPWVEKMALPLVLRLVVWAGQKVVQKAVPKVVLLVLQWALWTDVLMVVQWVFPWAQTLVVQWVVLLVVQ